jgi:hypothetical protein
MVDGMSALGREGLCPFIEAGHEPVLLVRHKHLAEMFDCLLSLGLRQGINENGMTTGDEEVFFKFWIVLGTALIEAVLDSLIGARVFDGALADEGDGLVSVPTCLDERALCKGFNGLIDVLALDLAEDLSAFLEAGIGTIDVEVTVSIRT